MLNELAVYKACSSFEFMGENLFHGRKRSKLSFLVFQDEASIFPMSFAYILEFEVLVAFHPVRGRRVIHGVMVLQLTCLDLRAVSGSSSSSSHVMLC